MRCAEFTGISASKRAFVPQLNLEFLRLSKLILAKGKLAGPRAFV